MSGYDYSDVLDGDGFEDQQTGKGLRKQLETVLEQNRKLIERLEAADRKSSTESLLKEQGINPAVAGLIPPDRDASDWLAEFGHLVGGNKIGEPAPTPEAQVTPDHEEERLAQARMEQGSGAGSHVVQDQDPFAKLNSFESAAEMEAFLNQERGTGSGQGLF